MPLGSFTVDKTDRLERELARLQADYAMLKGKSPEDLWREDLCKLRAALAAMSPPLV